MKMWIKGLLATGALGAIAAFAADSQGVFAAPTPLQTTYASPLSMSEALATASDPNLPATVAWVNGEAITNKAVAQAEILVSNDKTSPTEAPMTTAQLEKAALQLIVKQVVLGQAAKQQGLDATASEALQAWELIGSNAKTVQVITAGASSSLPTPPAAWIQGYEVSTGTNRLLQKAIANVPREQQAQVEASYIQNLINQANVVVAPGVP